MADRPPLSPAAQAVIDALCMDELNGPQQLMARAHAAAALRATTELPFQVPAYIRGDDYMYYIEGVESERQRNLAIANELDPQP
jgi:hypothetical protein